MSVSRPEEKVINNVLIKFSIMLFVGGSGRIQVPACRNIVESHEMNNLLSRLLIYCIVFPIFLEQS